MFDTIYTVIRYILKAASKSMKHNLQTSWCWSQVREKPLFSFLQLRADWNACRTRSTKLKLILRWVWAQRVFELVPTQPLHPPSFFLQAFQVKDVGLGEEETRLFLAIIMTWNQFSWVITIIIGILDKGDEVTYRGNLLVLEARLHR